MNILIMSHVHKCHTVTHSPLAVVGLDVQRGSSGMFMSLRLECHYSLWIMHPLCPELETSVLLGMFWVLSPVTEHVILVWLFFFSLFQENFGKHEQQSCQSTGRCLDPWTLSLADIITLCLLSLINCSKNSPVGLEMVFGSVKKFIKICIKY